MCHELKTYPPKKNFSTIVSLVFELHFIQIQDRDPDLSKKQTQQVS